MLTLLNQIRQQNGLSNLAFSAPLRNAARAHSADMLQRTDSSTTTAPRRPGTPASPATSRRRSPARTSPGAAALWDRPRASSASGCTRRPHRAIILTPGLHRVGLGLASGTFDGTAGAVWRPPTSPPEPSDALFRAHRPQLGDARAHRPADRAPPELDEQHLEGIEANLLRAQRASRPLHRLRLPLPPVPRALPDLQAAARS